jgi:hypothetical protein
MRFTLLHIDVARFATDDFNPFHDKHKWQRLVGNPFAGPIVLGFQLSAFLAHAVQQCREQEGSRFNIGAFRFSQLRVTFADAVRVDSDVTVSVRPTQVTDAGTTLSNRVVLRTERGLVLSGHARLRAEAPTGSLAFEGRPRGLNGIADRTTVPGTEFFLKRKYLTTANAKNFLVGSGVDPINYIDELDDRVCFPEPYPASLISSALLERGKLLHYDFIAAPMVYTYHDITTDLGVLTRLKSNDALNILVSVEHKLPADSALRHDQQVHTCLGYTGQGELLFWAEIGLVPLSALVSV